jgi:transposase
MRVMAKRYSDELRERATRMAVELRRDPATKVGALERVAEQLGMHPMTLRKWVRQAEVDGGVRPGTTSIEAERVARLEAENRELRRANEILRTASAFFAAAELDRRLS